jgi:hypothetical protein
MMSKELVDGLRPEGLKIAHPLGRDEGEQGLAGHSLQQQDVEAEPARLLKALQVVFNEIPVRRRGRRLLGSGDDLVLLEEVKESQQGQAEHAAMASAAGKLRHKRLDPRRQGYEVTDSLLCQEFTEPKELVGANAHCTPAVPLRSEVHEELVDRLSQPGAADTRASFRAG